MSSRKFFRLKVLLIVVVGFALISPLQDRLDERRRLMGYELRIILMPGHIAGSLVLAGFRGLAADLLWLQIEDLHHQGKVHQMLPLFRIVTHLQPQFITPWAVGGWHMAYNISVRFQGEPEEQFWIDTGIEFLKEGIEYNPERYDLYFELGWTYYHKVKNYKKAAEYFEMAARFPGPEYVDNILAHALFRSGREEEALDQWQTVKESGGTFSQTAGRLIENVQKYGHPTHIHDNR